VSGSPDIDLPRNLISEVVFLDEKSKFSIAESINSVYPNSVDPPLEQ
jgi:hypothetical protein